MSKIPTYGYGGDPSTIVTSGHGKAGVALPKLYPVSASMLGGDKFVVSLPGIVDNGLTDSFIGTALDSKWQDASVGGVVGVSNGVKLSVPKTGGVACIKSSGTYDVIDVSVDYTSDISVIRLYPTTDISFCELSVSIDDTTNFSVRHAWVPGHGMRIVSELISDNSVISSAMVNAHGSGGTLRIVKVGGSVSSFAGTMRVLDCSGWQSAPASVSILASCVALPMDILTTVTMCRQSAIVTFNGVMAHGVVMYGLDRIIGYIPPSMLPNVSIVNVYSGKSPYILLNAFTYIPSDQLTVSETSGMMVISNDDTLRDAVPGIPGLRL